MSTTTIKKTTTKTCDKCGATGLTWKKSTKTGRWYLSEDIMRRGYTGKQFRSSQPHNVSCSARKPAPAPLNTERPREYYVQYGIPEGPIENPETHVHNYVTYRPRPGSPVVGTWCMGCRFRLID